MKFTGVALILMGVMLALWGGVSYMLTDSATGEVTRVFPLNPLLTFAMATGSVAAGVLVVRYGGRGYSKSLSVPTPGGGPPTA